MGFPSDPQSVGSDRARQVSSDIEWLASGRLPAEVGLIMSRSATSFTKASVAELGCPPDRAEIIHWDAATPGFGLRAYRGGKRSWVVQYKTNGRTRRGGLGDTRIVPLDQARRAAKELLARVAIGQDPRAEAKAETRKAKQAVTVGQLIDAYLAHQQGRLRIRSLAEVTRHLRTHAKPLHNLVAGDVGRGEVHQLLAMIAARNGAVTSNRVRASLSAAFTFGLTTGRIEAQANVVAFTPRHGQEVARERVLSDAELRRGLARDRRRW